ncbi:GNAT family N-acetyltransferase [Allohahella sp. A8]|uniref:GNAT family N-acetyltransferase n=1 Tax=Allohahella sp. A8 TaxID=3141461 RepID=UPI003A7FAA66
MSTSTKPETRMSGTGDSTPVPRLKSISEPAQQALMLKVITTEVDFDQLAADWANLLHRSSCDALFNSWPWQRAWWQVWSQKLDLQLHLVATYLDDDTERLVGLLPVCFSPRDKVYAFLGALPRATFRSELLDALIDPDYEATVVARLRTYLGGLMAGADFFAADVPRHASIGKILKGLPVSGGAMILGHLTMTEDTVYEVDCQGGFMAYVSGLGKNSRLKLFNRRSYLQQHYPGTSVHERELVGSEGDGAASSGFLAFQPEFDRFHQLRWNKPFLGQDGLSFQSRFIDLCQRWNGFCADIPAVAIKPVVSVMTHQERTISLLYDVVVGDTRYNMQMGFAEDFDKKLSLGTLHLGYAIEAACEAGLRQYSFLAGSGRLAEASYKAHLATHTHPISSSCTAAKHRFIRLAARDLARRIYQSIRR